MGKEEEIRVISIPDGVDVEIDGNTVRISGPKGSIAKELWHPRVKIELDESTREVIVRNNINRRRERAIVGTFAAIIRNMITGVKEGFMYKLRVVHAHFPIQVKISDDGKRVEISNFLGERQPRTAKILEGTNVEIKGKEIIVTGIDKESVGQTAANIEMATRIKNFDPKVFQDGIYIVERSIGY